MKPVAWMFEKDGAYMCIKHDNRVNYDGGIPLYTHPVKEQLTDEDLEIITEALLMVGFMDDFVNYDLKEKALAILRKAQEK